MSVYRKRGAVVRWENGTLVRVAECGVAREDGERFECEPEVGEAPSLDAGEVVRVAAALRELRCERLIVVEGVAEHDCDGVHWRETTRRIHASLIRGRLRALVDLGSFDVDAVRAVAAALARASEVERAAPPLLRLAPHVAAALLPSLVGLAPPNVELRQTSGGVDGRGSAIPDVRIDAPPYPNWYRPSYRLRPMRMPLDLRLVCPTTEIDYSRPVAVALLAPVDGLILRVLVDDGADVFPCTVRVARIDAVARETVWYPYGGGSFGAEMML